jgi:Tfp pilus assembly protein PilF
MTTTCSNCHHDDCRPEDRFCVKCGRRLSQSRSEENDVTAITMPIADAAYVQVKLGTVYRKRGNADAAIRAFKKALEIDRTCVKAQQALAELQTDAGANGLSATGTDE